MCKKVDFWQNKTWIKLPSPSMSSSQASPSPSLSVSRWSGFSTFTQLSQASPWRSLSLFFWSMLGTNQQLSCRNTVVQALTLKGASQFIKSWSNVDYSVPDHWRCHHCLHPHHRHLPSHLCLRLLGPSLEQTCSYPENEKWNNLVTLYNKIPFVNITQYNS